MFLPVSGFKQMRVWECVCVTQECERENVAGSVHAWPTQRFSGQCCRVTPLGQQVQIPPPLALCVVCLSCLRHMAFVLQLEDTQAD